MEKSLLQIERLCAWYDRRERTLSDLSLELYEHETAG